MVALPNWVIGRNVSSVVFTPQSVDTAGTMTDTTPVGYFAARWKEFNIRSTNDLEDISASDQRRKNMVPVATGTRMEVTEIIQASAPDSNPKNPGAAAAYGSTDYGKFTVTRSGKTFTFYAVIESYEERSNGKGALEGTLVLEMVDPGTANPSYA